MRVDFFTIPVQAAAEATEELNRLLSSARILTVDRQFVADGASSFWSICIVSQTGPDKTAKAPSGKRGSIDYRDVLTAEDFAVYAKLRDLRKDLAERGAVPPYAVFTNEQLAAITQARVASLASLKKIEGIGDARVQKFGLSVVTQNFANLYLGSADRLVLQRPVTRGYVRYMDDLVWWGENRNAVRAALADLRSHIGEVLRLEMKTPVRIGRSRDGISFCGCRVFPDRLLLSRRRKRRFVEARREAEQQYLDGELDAQELQRKVDAALAITANADAVSWRREHLRRAPLARALAEVWNHAQEKSRNDGDDRVIRGGSWINNARNCRAAYRNDRHPENRNDNLGFRPARAPDRRGCAGPDQGLLRGVVPTRPSPKPESRRRAGRGRMPCESSLAAIT